MPAKETDLAVLRDWLVKEKPVAVGEIGLDFYLPDFDPVRQAFFFVCLLYTSRCV